MSSTTTTTTLTASTSTPKSSLSVAGQQWSSTVSPDFEEVILTLQSTLLDSAGSKGATEAYDVQEIEIAYEDYDSMLGSAPFTPDLTWDSQPSSGADFQEEHRLKSVFEEWDDTLPTNTGTFFTGSNDGVNNDHIPRIQVVEEDGSQVLLIPADSDFYSEPQPLKKVFQLHFADLPEIPSSPVIFVARDRTSTLPAEPASPFQTLSPTTAMRKASELMLFVDTTALSATSWTFNSSTGNLTPAYLSPASVHSDVEESTWVPKGTPTYGLDVPLDCHCFASPIEPL